MVARRQELENDQATIYKKPPVKALKPARIRTVVLNRYPSKGLAGTVAVKAVETSLIELLAGCYVHNPGIFAEPHLPPECSKPPPAGGVWEDTVEFVSQMYTQRVIDLAGTTQVSVNVGVGVSTLSGAKYTINLPDYRPKAAAAILSDNTPVPAKARLGVDAVKFALQIQDLVELSQASSRHPTFLLKGSLYGQNESTRNTDRAAFDPIVSPEAKWTCRKRVGKHSPDCRGCRRIPTLEDHLVRWVSKGYESAPEAKQEKGQEAGHGGRHLLDSVIRRLEEEQGVGMDRHEQGRGTKRRR